MTDLSEKKLQKMIDNSVSIYLGKIAHKIAHRDINDHIKIVLSTSRMLDTIRFQVDQILENLFNHELEQHLKPIISKNFPPNIIYVHEKNKIPPPLRPFYVKEAFLLPASPCIYFLCKDDRIVYIGKTINLNSRLGDHILHKNFDRVFYMEVSQNDLDRIESTLIEYYNPELNLTGNGGKDSVKIERQRR